MNDDDLSRLRHAIRDEALPCAALDVAAFDRNHARITTMTRAHGLPLRIATKSLRVPALIDRLLKRGPELQGLLCFAVREPSACMRWVMTTCSWPIRLRCVRVEVKTWRGQRGSRRKA